MILTGENLTDAQPGFDSQNQQPKVDLTVDAKGGRIMRDTSRENIKKRMAILLFEKGKGEVLTAPVIQSELGNRFQISGSMSVSEANDLALLLRAGSLAAPMEIIEERTIGPTLGAENISKGFQSVSWGFLVIVIFMGAYYMLFGLFSGLALAVNLLLLVAVLSMLQATLTLPGMAAMALALGMAIDSNVLINERVREELRNGASPQAAIHAGYERAWATILDSNISTLIAAEKTQDSFHWHRVASGHIRRRGKVVRPYLLSFPRTPDGIFQNPPRHSLHAACAGVQCRQFRDFCAGRVFPVFARASPVG